MRSPFSNLFHRLRYGGIAVMLSGIFWVAGCGQTTEQPEKPEAEQKTPAQIKAGEARARLTASDGGKTVLRAIEAQGGLEAWYGAPTSSYKWEYSNVQFKLRFKSSLVADNQTRRVYHELLMLGTPDHPEPAEGRFAWDGTDAWISPARIKRINPRFWATTGYYFESIPFVLADPGLHYEALPAEELDGVPHDMVRVSYGSGVGDSPDDTYTLYVNRDSGRVDAIRYTVTYGRRRGNAANRPPGETLFYYEDYVTVDGLTVPTRFRGYGFKDGKKGAFKNEAWASDISFRQPFDATRLEKPADARIQPMPDAGRSSD